MLSFLQCGDQTAELYSRSGRTYTMKTVDTKHPRMKFARLAFITISFIRFDDNKSLVKSHSERSHDIHYYMVMNKKLSYRRGTARCVVSVEISPTATQQCRNYLYTTSRKQIEVLKLDSYSGPMCNKYVHSTVTRSSRFHCLIGVINKPTTDVLLISPVYRRFAVAEFSKFTM